jgi:hypothetical protein
LLPILFKYAVQSYSFSGSAGKVQRTNQTGTLLRHLPFGFDEYLTGTGRLQSLQSKVRDSIVNFMGRTLRLRFARSEEVAIYRQATKAIKSSDDFTVV